MLVIRRRGRGDETVEVVVDDQDDDALAASRTRRLRHPWRWATALLVVAALALAATTWRRMGREVEVVDAGRSWSSDLNVRCDDDTTTSIHVVTPQSAAADTADRLGEDPADIVTLTNRGARTVILRVADPTTGAFEPDVVDGSAVEPVSPTADRVRTVDHVSVPAGDSARLRLVSPRVVGGDEAGTAVATVTSVRLRVTSLGVTTSQDVRLRTRIVGVSVGTAAAATVDPGMTWSLDGTMCGPTIEPAQRDGTSR
ncbi:hypothetical protein ACFT5B_06365 [Luteimicrobium sp. NPDC057192]|uniref:hypothetical protein n=1 Tax=Luteimicrobium sp. NPDC057192 TaxID=3346042 RepID=UPI00363673B5